mmetsp:Transcript_60042/g.142148  ORF Transcript_60042/g.142148 Transcript_60042/m.142148 type:complete len:263 (+) Transcript_60042:1817-2605(+)
MADKQLAARAHHAVDALEHLALRRRVEIDHDIAAEDHVESVAELPLGVHQVQRAELHPALQLGLHADLAGVRARAPHEEVLQPGGVQAARVGVVDAPLGGGQHIGVDVAGDELHRGAGPERLAAGHQDGIGLLARRRGAAPDPHRFADEGLEVVLERVEMVFLAKEGGQVGRQAVDEFLPFLGARRAARCFEPLQIAGEAPVSRLAQAPREPAVDHRMLAIVQADAGMLVDQLAHAVEVGLAEAEFMIQSVAALGDVGCGHV